MSPLSLFLVLSGILVVFAIFNWKARFKAARKFEEEQAIEAAARRERLGPNYKTDSGQAEAELPLYEPPDDYLTAHIDLNKSMEEVDAALDKRNQLLQDSVGIGASRFGGVPDLPPNMPWPVFEGKKLPFLAQIDLTTLPKSLLPSEGWLYAFGLCDDDHVGKPVIVFHHEGPRANLVRAERPHRNETWLDWTNRCDYKTVPLKPTSNDGWTSEAGQFFGDLAKDEGGSGDVADQAERSGADWITLMAISSTGSMEWSDCGWFHIVIRRVDLTKRNFSDVCAGLSLVG